MGKSDRLSDPVYDLAHHAHQAHKAMYVTGDRSRGPAGWTPVAPAECRTVWTAGFDFVVP
ncbi:hypothetical protein [Streptomyces sp. D54]|uniref:hypothetical protein n=1 Tax=Streptomyces sp. D54 TaxID=1290289 RepID=UPI003CE7E6B0